MYKRVLLKLSGEALSSQGNSFDPNILANLAKELREVHDLGVDLAIVVGGGNFIRGKIAEQMGIQTAIEMQKVAEPFIVRKAIRHLEKGRVVIFGAGTGNPYFSTDTTAALRASEIKADVILMAKNGVDGVYDADPKTHPEATKYDTLSYMDLIKEGLQVMDTTATSMCMDNEIDLVVFNMNESGNIVKAVRGEITGTTISKEG